MLNPNSVGGEAGDTGTRGSSGEGGRVGLQRGRGSYPAGSCRGSERVK